MIGGARTRPAPFADLVRICGLGLVLILIGIGPLGLRQDIDFTPIWQQGSALLHGQPFTGTLGRGVFISYPAPFIVLTSPLGILSHAGMVFAVRLACMLILMLVVSQWRGSAAPMPFYAWALLASLPAVDLVNGGSVMSAFDLVCLSGAVWAQRRDRWWLVGVMLSLGLERPSNTLPIAAMLAMGAWGRPRKLAVAILAGGLVLIPLVVIATLWDRDWVHAYSSTLSAENMVSPFSPLVARLGLAGDLLLVGAGTLLGIGLAWPDRGGPVATDRAALVLMLTIWLTNLHGPYIGIYALPAVVRLAQRPGLEGSAWIALLVPWIGVATLTRVLGSPVEIWVLWMAIPPLLLLRKAPPELAEQPARS